MTGAGDAIRVLHVIDSMNPGGAQRVLLHLLGAMDRRRFACDVAVLHGPGPVAAEFETQGLQPIFLARSKWDPRIPWRLRRLIHDRQYAIVHAHLVASGFLCETLRSRLRIPRLVVHLHGLYRSHDGDRYQNMLEALMYRRADRVAACSQGVLDSIPRAIPGLVLQNGLSDETLEALAHPPSRREARSVLGLDADAFLVGTVGRVSAGKNHALLCRAVGAARDLPNMQGVIVGAGPEASAVQTAAAESDAQVAITGHQPGVRPYLAAMDVFVMTSRAEGMPMAVIEAMAAGKACLLPDTAWARELADGDAAAFYIPDDAGALAAEIRRLAKDEALRDRLGAAARARAQSAFSARHMAQNAACLYEELLRS